MFTFIPFVDIVIDWFEFGVPVKLSAETTNAPLTAVITVVPSKVL